ncbi:peptidase S26B, signal peptidase [Haloferax sulfurifontis ATCC BAA-897]|uniref:Peptidase S26B, signal peptidase n=1 Tax=Haloferax sulfurifontis ATCC BAA-897 TaxID=662480 RepID=M0INQ5_9EURY|nr:peptidase S26B, signal peptidase [Haloferax sulfurifontis ATCC BAA-897]
MIGTTAIAGGLHNFVVLSSSMVPTYNPGDVVVVESVRPEHIEEGDVITFNDTGQAGMRNAAGRTTHRVVGVNHAGESTTFTTKGDANEEPDVVPVQGDDVVGRVVFAVPVVGQVFLFAERSSRMWVAIVVVLPASVLVLSEVRELVAVTGQTDRAARLERGERNRNR